MKLLAWHDSMQGFISSSGVRSLSYSSQDDSDFEELEKLEVGGRW